MEKIFSLDFKTLFDGIDINLYPMMLYFLKNYKNACVPLLGSAGEKTIHWTCKFDSEGVCERKLITPRNFEKAFLLCQKKSNVRFLFGFISLFYPDGNQKLLGGHANAYLVDLKDIDGNGNPTISVEIFEPHGTIEGGFDNYSYLRELEKLFKRLGVTSFYNSSDFCPKMGFQSIQVDEIQDILKSDPVGFCMAWSIW